MCPGPWYTCDSRIGDALIIISIVLAAIWAFFLLVDYLNNRRIYHLTWAFSFIALWIVFHQVTFKGYYYGLTTDMIAAVSSFIPGGIAAGLVFAVFPGKKLMDKVSYGLLYSVFVIAMAFFIAFFKLPRIMQAIGSEAWLGSIFVVLSHVVSSAVIIGLPIYTYVKKETTWRALLFSVGGVLLGAAGVGVSLLLTGIIAPEVTFTLFPYLLLFATFSFALGTFFTAKWRFDIPGVELEE